MTMAFDIMLQLARRLGIAREGDSYVASGGSTTTLVCSTLTENDDYWNGGTLFITYDAGGAGAPPQNQSREITDFVASTDTVTVGTAFTASVGAGDKFVITKNDYPRYILLQAINAALQWWGDIAHTDDTSLDTAANTLEYSLPAAAVDDLRQVYIAMRANAPLDFAPFPYWRVDKGNGKLVFRVQPDSGRDIRLVYVAPHSSIASDSDMISPQVSLPALYEYALSYAYFWRIQTVGRDDRKWVDFYNQCLSLANNYKREFPRTLPARDPSYIYSASTRTQFNPHRIADPG